MRSRASTRRFAGRFQIATANMPRSRVKDSLSHCRKALQNGFGVGVRGKPVSELFQFVADFQVIVNLAVEDDAPLTAIFEDRLIAALEVDNFQPGRAKRKQAPTRKRPAGPVRGASACPWPRGSVLRVGSNVYA